MINTKSKNKLLLDDFVGYCGSHPELRFWQALLAWSGYTAILGEYVQDGQSELEDTFHLDK